MGDLFLIGFRTMTTEYEFHPGTLHNRWRLVQAAASTEKPEYQYVMVEMYERGVRLIATDSYVLATCWVPSLDNQDAEAPWIDTEGEQSMPYEWFTIPAKDTILDALLADREADTITMQRNVNDHSLTFTGNSAARTVAVSQEKIGDWRHLFTERPDHTDEIVIGTPVFKYFTRIASLIQPEFSVVMRWYNKSGVSPFQFSVEQHALRGLAMPVRM